MKKVLLLLIIGSYLFGASCEKSLLDLKIKKSGVRLSSIIEGIANDCGYSIFYENGGDGIQRQRVSLLYLERKTPMEMIDFLLSKHNFNYTLEDKTLIISKYATKTFRVNYIDMQRGGKSKAGVLISSSVTSDSSGAASDAGSSGTTIDSIEKFDFWKSIEKEVKALVVRPEDGDNKPSKIITNKKSGFITVTGTSKQLARVKKYLDNVIDRVNKQVLVDVKIISVTLDKSHKTGIDWSKLSLGFGFEHANTQSSNISPIAAATGTGVTIGSLSGASTVVIPKQNNWAVSQFNTQGKAILDFIKSHGKTRSLSNPKIISINNQPSLISVGSNVNYLVENSSTTDSGTSTSDNEVKDIFVGILLDITSQVDEQGYVTLRINPSISNFKYSADDTRQVTPRRLPPDTITRRISTVVRVKDGETIVLGGLITTEKGNTQNGVKIIGSIPYIGRLFTSNDIKDSITEIVFIVKPKIITSTKKLSLKSFEYTQINDVNVTQ